MHSVDLLEEALDIAQQSGYEIRREWLSESTGGACRIGSKHVLFVDLSLPADEQLAQAVQSLRHCDFLNLERAISLPLKRLLDLNEITAHASEASSKLQNKET